MKIDNGLYECFNCQKECDETEIKLDKNWRGELGYVCEECFNENSPTEYTENDRLWQYYEDIEDERKCCNED